MFRLLEENIQYLAFVGYCVAPTPTPFFKNIFAMIIYNYNVASDTHLISVWSATCIDINLSSCFACDSIYNNLVLN